MDKKSDRGWEYLIASGKETDITSLPAVFYTHKLIPTRHGAKLRLEFRGISTLPQCVHIRNCLSEPVRQKPRRVSTDVFSGEESHIKVGASSIFTQ